MIQSLGISQGNGRGKNRKETCATLEGVALMKKDDPS